MTTEPTQKRKILLATDLTGGEFTDLAVLEIKQLLLNFYGLDTQPPLEIEFAPVDPFNTVQSGQLVKQAALSGDYDALFVITDPRRDYSALRDALQNQGNVHRLGNHSGVQTGDSTQESAAYIAVDAGGKTVHIVGVNEGENFSSIVAEGGRIRTLSIPRTNDQFRARRVIKELAEILQGNTQSVTDHQPFVFPPATLAEEIDLDIAALQARRSLEQARPHITLGRPGDVTQGYVTFISNLDKGARSADLPLPDTAAEVDVIRLEDGPWNPVSAGFAANQLAGSAVAQGWRNRTFVLSPDGQLNFDRHADNPELFVAALSDGVRILTTDPASLLFVKDQLQSLQSYDAGRYSIGFEPLRINGIARDRAGEIDRLAPTPEGLFVGHIDRYGNIKLGNDYPTVLNQLLSPADRTHFDHGANAIVTIRITDRNGLEHEHEAILSRRFFSIPEDAFGIIDGSSGRPPQHFAEIIQRDGNARQGFVDIEAGSAVSFTLKRMVDISHGHDFTGHISALSGRANGVEPQELHVA